MKLIGRITAGARIIREDMVEIEDADISYHDLLERCFISLCRNMNISVPMWLNKNTKEYARYRRTSFEREQFIEEIGFDRFEINVDI